MGGVEPRGRHKENLWTMTTEQTFFQRHSGWLITAIVLLAVVADQALKLYIHSHYVVGESHRILPFFYLCYVENDGMAFGIEWGNKLFLTLFRIVAVVLLSVYMYKLNKKGTVSPGYLTMLALTTAGAIGNIIDCMFYGIAFGDDPLFYGKVIDMLYFPLITNSAGECIFFKPVFNLADTCITVSVFAILIFYRKELNESLADNPQDEKK